MCPPCMRGVCCTVSCNGSEKTAAPFTNGLQVFHVPFRFGVYTAYISRRESRFPAPPLIREKKPFFQINPNGLLPAREESQIGRPTIPPLSGVSDNPLFHYLFLFPFLKRHRCFSAAWGREWTISACFLWNFKFYFAFCITKKLKIAYNKSISQILTKGGKCL